MRSLSHLYIELLVLHLLLLPAVHSHVLEGGGDMDKKGGSKQEVAKLEDFLVRSWQELDRMLFCTKLPMCVIRYKKIFRIGKQNVSANLIQSLTLTLHQIKDITNKLKKFKRYQTK